MSTDWIQRGGHASVVQELPGGGGSATGFFTCDFTLEEVQSLWATQVLPFRDSTHNREHRCSPCHLIPATIG